MYAYASVCVYIEDLTLFFHRLSLPHRWPFSDDLAGKFHEFLYGAPMEIAEALKFICRFQYSGMARIFVEYNKWKKLNHYLPYLEIKSYTRLVLRVISG